MSKVEEIKSQIEFLKGWLEYYEKAEAERIEGNARLVEVMHGGSSALFTVWTTPEELQCEYAKVIYDLGENFETSEARLNSKWLCSKTQANEDRLNRYYEDYEKLEAWFDEQLDKLETELVADLEKPKLEAGK